MKCDMPKARFARMRAEMWRRAQAHHRLYRNVLMRRQCFWAAGLKEASRKAASAEASAWELIAIEAEGIGE
jgi:hypothetical protein